MPKSVAILPLNAIGILCVTCLLHDSDITVPVITYKLYFNVEGYSCDVTYGSDFSTIASPIKVKSKISICYFDD